MSFTTVFETQDIASFAREALFYQQVFPLLPPSLSIFIPKVYGIIEAEHAGFRGITLEHLPFELHTACQSDRWGSIEDQDKVAVAQ